MLIPKVEDIKSNPKGLCNPRTLKKYYPEFYKIISEYPGIKYSEKLYNYFFPGDYKCIVCGKPTKFKNFIEGYKQFCCAKCASIGTIDKREQTCINKYGVKNYSQTQECKDKVKQTCDDKFGGQGYKIRPMLGDNNPMKKESVKKKAQETCLKRYGVKHVLQNQYFLNKLKIYNLEKYGIEYILQRPDIRDQIKDTCLKKYNVDNPMKSNMISKKNSTIRRNNYLLKNEQLLGYTEKGNWICRCPHNDCKLKNECTGYYETKHQIQYDRTRLNIEPCTILNPIGSLYKGISNSSQQYFNELKKYFPDLLTEYQLYKYKLDAYIPSLKICIEYNGIYWHCKPELYNSDYYNKMANKTAQQIWDHDRERKEYIESKGIKVITIWEDELPNPKNLYKNIVNDSK